MLIWRFENNAGVGMYHNFTDPEATTTAIPELYDKQREQPTLWNDPLIELPRSVNSHHWRFGFLGLKQVQNWMRYPVTFKQLADCHMSLNIYKASPPHIVFSSHQASFNLTQAKKIGTISLKTMEKLALHMPLSDCTIGNWEDKLLKDMEKP